MKKIFKIFATAVATLTAIFAISLFAACGNNDNGGNGGNTTDPATTYYFTVVGSDDKPINGQTGGRDGGKVAIQICTEMCVDLNPLGITLGTDGKVSITQKQVNEFFTSSTDITEFAFHALHVPGYEDDCAVEVNGPGNYTLKLTEAEPEAPHECESECPICGKCTDAECTEDACKDKCTGHVYELTVMLPDGSAAANMTIKVANGDRTAKIMSENNKANIDLIQMISYVGKADSYTVTIEVPGGYTKTITLNAITDNYKLTINLEA